MNSSKLSAFATLRNLIWKMGNSRPGLHSKAPRQIAFTKQDDRYKMAEVPEGISAVFGQDTSSTPTTCAYKTEPLVAPLSAMCSVNGNKLAIEVTFQKHPSSSNMTFRMAFEIDENDELATVRSLDSLDKVHLDSHCTAGGTYLRSLMTCITLTVTDSYSEWSRREDLVPPWRPLKEFDHTLKVYRVLFASTSVYCLVVSPISVLLAKN